MTIKAIIRKKDLKKINSQISGEVSKVYPVVLYCNDRGKVYYVSTGLTTSDESLEFNDSRNLSERVEKMKRLDDILTNCGKFIEANKNGSVEDLKSGIQSIAKGGSLHKKKVVDYVMRCFKDKQRKLGLSDGTGTVYMQLRNKLTEYDADVTFEGIDSAWLKRFETDMRRTMSTNGLAIPMRTLKAVFNWARDKGLTENYPFKEYVVRKQRVKHFALTAQLVADIRDYPVEPYQERYRDCWLLMFYLCGIDSVDLAGLTEENIRRGRIVFTRQKNDGKSDIVEVDIPINPEAREIIRRYRGKEHLLEWFDGRADYNSFTRVVNETMKQIGYYELVPDKVGKKRKVKWHGLLEECSTKTARRSFTTIARRLGVPEVMVGQTLGHYWVENTTQIYECFDQEDVDLAIRRVLDHVGSLKGRSKEEICEEIRLRDEI